jgi:hypothetical protein
VEQHEVVEHQEGGRLPEEAVLEGVGWGVADLLDDDVVGMGAVVVEEFVCRVDFAGGG